MLDVRPFKDLTSIVSKSNIFYISKHPLRNKVLNSNYDLT